MRKNWWLAVMEGLLVVFKRWKTCFVGNIYLSPFFVLFLIGCFMISNLAKADMTLNHKGFTYVYEKTPIINKNNDIDYYDGRIQIKNESGELVYSSLTGNTPGCEGEIKPISLLKMKFTNFPRVDNFQNEKEYVVFCGNNEGHHNLMRIYDPALGVVAVMDFMDGPVDFSQDSDGVYSARVYYTLYTGLGLKLRYPVYYRLEKSGTTLTFNSQSQNSFSDLFYESYIDRKLESFINYETKGNGYSALSVAIQTDNVERICLSLKKITSLLDDSEIKKMREFIEEFFNQRETLTRLKCEEK